LRVIFSRRAADFLESESLRYDLNSINAVQFLRALPFANQIR